MRRPPVARLVVIVLLVLALAGGVLLVAARYLGDPDQPDRRTGVPQPEPQVSVANARLVMPASGTEAAIYLELTNRADAALFLTEASLDNSGKAMIAYLRSPAASRVASIAIPEGETLRLIPETGYAIITDYDASVVPGATVPLTLTFSDGQNVRVPLEVQSMVGQDGVVRMPPPVDE